MVIIGLYLIYVRNNPDVFEFYYIYIGSTKDFKQRKAAHRKTCNNINPRYNLKIYQMIRENGGWDCCDMVPIEEIECDNYLQARIREEYWRKEYNANMNTIKAYTRIEEQKQQNTVTSKKRYESNKDIFKQIYIHVLIWNIKYVIINCLSICFIHL